jgi:hypothetical protein
MSATCILHQVIDIQQLLKNVNVLYSDILMLFHKRFVSADVLTLQQNTF